VPRRLEFWFYALVILGAMVYGLGQREEVPQDRRMPRPPVENPSAATAFRLPPPARERMIARTLEPMPLHEPGQFSSGTAFAVNTQGDWLTARHVTRNCTSLLLVSEDTSVRVPVARVIENQGTDLSLLQTRAEEPQVTFTRRDPLPDEDGFHIGFPQGQPTSVRSGFLGVASVDLGAANGSPFDHIHTVGHVWAERERLPSLSGTLGGLSGGPTFDGMGAVIGVTVAEQPRRGRVVTIPPEAVEDMLKRLAIPGWQNVPDDSGRDPGITQSNFDRFGEEMRRAVTVARVYCFRSEFGSRRGYLR